MGFNSTPKPGGHGFNFSPQCPLLIPSLPRFLSHFVFISPSSTLKIPSIFLLTSGIVCSGETGVSISVQEVCWCLLGGVMRRLCIALSILGLLFVGGGFGLVGCSNTQEPTCEKDGDCPSGWICRNKECAKSSSASCQRDKDCPSGQRCELASGQCYQCLQDDDCNFGLKCINRTCSDGSQDGGPADGVMTDSPDNNGGLVCKSDSDCKSGERCEVSSGTCIPEQGNQCKTDNECAGDKYCVSGTCTPGRRPCQDNGECNGGFYCEGGFCYRNKCQSNNDCPPGKSCDTLVGQCKTSNPSDCAQTGCPQGQVCNPTSRQCEATQNCTQTGCPTGQTCNATTGKCEAGSGQDCTQSGCPSGQVCNSSTKQCEPASSGCTSDATCIPPNGTCKNGTCVNCQQAGCPTNKWCNPSTGRCIDTPPACTSNADCTAPRGSCISGGCLSCASQFTCPTNKVCNQASGLCEEPPCVTDSDCTPPNGSCQSGTCLSCTKDFTCPSGQPCNSSTGRCGSAPPACTSNSQCSAPNGTCQNGQCVSCSTVGCPSGQTCSSSTGRCSSSSSCVVDSQCSAPLGWCRSGRCTSCVINSCPSGQTCNSSTGRCSTSSSSCTADSQCSTPNGWCRSGRCTTCRFYSCSSNLQCNSSTGRCEPKSCTSNSNCKAPKGACYNGKCASCDGDFTCPSSQACDKASGLCQPKPACVKQSDCFSGKVCLGGQCLVAECGPANPCSDGQICENRACRPAYKRCYSYLCGAKDSCLYGPDKKDRCHQRCGIGGSLCPTGQECLSVKLTDGQTDKFCFPQASLDVNKSCKPGNLNERCKNQGACLITSSFSSTGYCYDRCTPGSSLGCKSTQECAELSPGKGLCLSKGSGSKGSSCNIFSSRCRAQFICVMRTTTSTSGTCRARCTSPGRTGTSAGCATGETCVASPYSRTGGACVPDGNRSDGYSCKLFSSYACKAGLICSVPASGTTDEGTCTQRCQSASNCSSSNEDCVNGACQPKPTGREGSTCRYGSSLGSYYCKPPLQCYFSPGSTSSYGTCYKPCTRDSDCTSSTYGRCNGGFCQKSGSRKEFDICNSTSPCQSGLVCAALSSFTDRCVKPCKSNSDCGSSYPECSSGICLKKGTLVEDKYCSDSYTSRCAVGLQCARPPGSSFSSRRCYRSCKTNSDCTGTYKVCKASSDGSNVCYK